MKTTAIPATLKRAGYSVGLGCALAVLAGCQNLGSQSVTRLDPVGPRSGAALSPAPANARGWLIVYSDTFASDSGQIRTLPHREYTIQDASGKFVERVANHTSLADKTPERVALSPGRYRVIARGSGVGVVETPVLIVPGDVTEVNLDYPGMSSTELGNTNDVVRLADGRIVGRRAAGY